MTLTVLFMLAQAANAMPAQPPMTPAKVEKREKQICVVEDQTGSRLSGQRVCRSKTEWDIVRGEIQETLNLRQRNTIK